ncbi:biotin/lipoyl-binding protein [Methylocapsa sp. D3K7]|uniref:HlyD family secretion protein n=1 Tax=Methylocapsa sp. D3K7 TaxID=3041435 RepID=UPI00244E8215|nr:biotin/lipoyl-binding protein [Methylocapsa sp. D3K7]WGJ13231.1 biotin/lipoyl-binding protein [Methylocapsa sp. D3K7]
MSDAVLGQRAEAVSGAEGAHSRSEARPPRTLRRLSITGALALTAIAAWFGSGWWDTKRFLESTDDAYVGADITPIAAKVPGFIENIAVADNQPVHAGDLLFRLDSRDYRTALAKAEAAVGMQEAQLANLESMRSLQDALIAEARASIEPVWLKLRGRKATRCATVNSRPPQLAPSKTSRRRMRRRRKLLPPRQRRAPSYRRHCGRSMS